MDESYRGQLRLIVSANGFLGPANRRRVFPVMVGGALVAPPTSDPISKTLYPNPNSSLRLADSPEPTPETISRRGILKFRPLAKLISGKPVLFDLSSFGLPPHLPPSKTARNRPSNRLAIYRTESRHLKAPRYKVARTRRRLESMKNPAASRGPGPQRISADRRRGTRLA